MANTPDLKSYIRTFFSPSASFCSYKRKHIIFFPTHSDMRVLSSPIELQSNHPISILITLLKYILRMIWICLAAAVTHKEIYQVREKPCLVLWFCYSWDLGVVGAAGWHNESGACPSNGKFTFKALCWPAEVAVSQTLNPCQLHGPVL